MFFRKITTRKNGKEYVYVKLIENYRQDGKVKQRVIANFGSLESLSSDRLNYLIASLKKLHREIGNQPNDSSVSGSSSSKINELRMLLTKVMLRQDLLKVLDPQTYAVTEALLIKNILAGDVIKPVQEICKGLGLLDTTSLQFYNAMKKMGQEELKEILLRNRISCVGIEANQPVLIHLIKSNFEGMSFEVDLTNNIYMPQNYQKEMLLMLAYDQMGNPLDFEYVEEDNEVTEQLDSLLQRLERYFNGTILILDSLNCIKPSKRYCVARMVSDIPDVTETPNTFIKLGDQVYFQVTFSTQANENKVKETKAKLAKVSAGLENIKADILLGKLTRESAIKKKAEQVIKSNQCEDLVTYQFDHNTNFFSYTINEELFRQKKQSRYKANWVVSQYFDQLVAMDGFLNNIQIKTDQFHNITDQLNIPPINMYVDYHYTTEIISGHIQLEIMKKQILSVMNTPSQGGGAY